jgi:hypothetical protein
MLVLPSNAKNIWNRFFNENKVLVYKYVVREIKKAIDKNEEVISLFQFEDSSFTATLKKQSFVETLNEAIKLFVKEEEFEYAEKTKKIINEYLIETVIKESQNIGE